MHARLLSLSLLLPLLCASAQAAEKAAYDSNGRIVSLIAGAEDFPITTGIVALLPTGRRIPLGMRRESNGAVRQKDNALAWSVPFTLPDGGAGRIDLHSTEAADSVLYSTSITATNNLNVDAIEFVVDLPRPAFLGGHFYPDAAPSILLGPVKPLDSAFFRGNGMMLRFTDAAFQRTLDIMLDQPRQISLIDRWDATGRSFQLRVPITRGAWSAGATATIAATLHLTEKSSAVPVAHLTVDPSTARYKFQGFGGNYCWDNRSPIAAYTSDHLKIAWARTAMKLVDWDRQHNKDGDHPSDELLADFSVMQRLQKRGVPLVMSVWALPERFYTDPYEKPSGAYARTIDPEKWDELLDLIGNYLLYAKREYSAEPDLFSFNESNIGINIGQTPVAHARAVERIGAYFQKLGLKTKMLLGDAAGPRDTHNFALAAASDPEAMKFAGAVAFHSWGGGSPDQYSAWGDLAQWLNLPLLVTELGVDASAYYTRAWDSYDYGLREARMTQELLTFARPQAMLFWQFTDDFALARVNANGAVEPTSRFWLMKHFADLTPSNSDALATSSDQPSVWITAFRGGSAVSALDGSISVYRTANVNEPSGKTITLHVLNLGASRSVEISGLPDATWNRIETTEEAQYQSKPAVQTKSHSVTLDLPARSLVTLFASN